MSAAFDSDTIVALATPPGRGGVAVIRISGPSVGEIAERIVTQPLRPRYAQYGDFYDADGVALDSGLALFFPRPHSFTGEDVLELHGHGGTAVTDLLLRRIVDLGARPARPGEFSRRAFLNGKLDLTQAEAIADLVDATGEAAARCAIQSLQGAFSRHIDKLAGGLADLRMYVEAAIDFPEEEIDFLADGQIAAKLDSLIKALAATGQAAQQGCLLREGMTVALIGAPNVGKSSLLNRLSDKEAAIVTDIAGTTRDVLRESIHIDGMPLHVLDTAGLRRSEDVIEREGMRRTEWAMRTADAILRVRDAVALGDDAAMMSSSDKPVVEIVNKIDLIGHAPKIVKREDGKATVYLSAKSGQGIDLLKCRLAEMMGFHAGEGVFMARRRHLTALQRTAAYLDHGKKQLQCHRAGELLAEDLRLAQRALDEITGVFTTDDLLDKIFSGFCIGK